MSTPPPKTATMTVKLATGKEAALQVPADMSDEDALYMVRAILDFRLQLKQGRPGIVVSRPQTTAKS